MRIIQELIRYSSFIGFSALAAYAYTCPCGAIYACHVGQFAWIWLGLGLVNWINLAIYFLF
jgi:hypothetical protein